jgi:uncharacterized membrane protein
MLNLISCFLTDLLLGDCRSFVFFTLKYSFISLKVVKYNNSSILDESFYKVLWFSIKMFF